jgi:hypothetical protein
VQLLSLTYVSSATELFAVPELLDLLAAVQQERAFQDRS